VKFGSGAFMPTLEKSRELATSICEVGNSTGMKTAALLTDMNEPLAPCAGNAIEVRCAIDYLTGRAPHARPARLHEITIALSAQLLVTAGLARNIAEGAMQCEAALDSGKAAEKFVQMVAALGGPGDILERAAVHLPLGAYVCAVPALRDGVVCSMDTRALGLAVVTLGGGRRRSADNIDFAVGIDQFVSIGQSLRAGEPLAQVYARDEASAAEAVNAIQQAINMGDTAPAARSMILD
jgi:thymidine phosphorylase